MENDWLITGRNIRQLRADAGLSQLDLAKITGLTVQSINRIEKGKVTPRRSNLELIAKALKVTPGRLTSSQQEYNSPAEFARELLRQLQIDNLDAEAIEILGAYNRLNSSHRNTLLKTARSLLDREFHQTTGRRRRA
jgi:transcriptional regulator with XRE-family HTH domain